MGEGSPILETGPINNIEGLGSAVKAQIERLGKNAPYKLPYALHLVMQSINIRSEAGSEEMSGGGFRLSREYPNASDLGEMWKRHLDLDGLDGEALVDEFNCRYQDAKEENKGLRKGDFAEQIARELLGDYEESEGEE